MENLTCTLDFGDLDEATEFTIHAPDGATLNCEVDGDLGLKIMFNTSIPGYDLTDEIKVLEKQAKLFEFLHSRATIQTLGSDSENGAGEDPYIILWMKPPELQELLGRPKNKGFVLIKGQDSLGVYEREVGPNEFLMGMEIHIDSDEEIYACWALGINTDPIDFEEDTILQVFEKVENRVREEYEYIQVEARVMRAFCLAYGLEATAEEGIYPREGDHNIDIDFDEESNKKIIKIWEELPDEA